MPIHSHPDIRNQTIEQARQHIEAVRVRRMVTVHTFTEKREAQLSKLHDAELKKFNNQASLVDKAIDNVDNALSKLESAIQKLELLNSNVTNIEQEYGNL